MKLCAYVMYKNLFYFLIEKVDSVIIIIYFYILFGLLCGNRVFFKSSRYGRSIQITVIIISTGTCAITEHRLKIDWTVAHKLVLFWTSRKSSVAFIPINFND